MTGKRMKVEIASGSASNHSSRKALAKVGKMVN
jgi:hypothetical protein